MGKSSFLGTLEDSFEVREELSFIPQLISKVFSLVEESKDSSIVEARCFEIYGD
jgi:hypothetical protein